MNFSNSNILCKSALVAILLSVAFQSAHADLPTALRHVDNAALVGKGRLRVLLFNVFDARLYAPNGLFNADEPFALSLSYLRRLKGDKIVASSVSELKKQGLYDATLLSQWKSELARIIPDVDQNSTITGVRDALGNTRFYLNGVPIGSIDDPQFTQGFFNIWLGESTSKPALRNQLLNGQSS